MIRGTLGALRRAVTLPATRLVDQVRPDETAVAATALSHTLARAARHHAAEAAERQRVIDLAASGTATEAEITDALDYWRAKIRAAAVADRPPRHTATPAQVDAYLRQVLGSRALLRYQQAIGHHAVTQACRALRQHAQHREVTGTHRLSKAARAGWEQAAGHVDPANGAGPWPRKLTPLPDTPDTQEPPEAPEVPGQPDAAQGGGAP